MWPLTTPSPCCGAGSMTARACGREGRSFDTRVVLMTGSRKSGSGMRLLDDGAERERGDEGECAHDDDGSYEHADEERRVRRERPVAHRHDLLLHEGSGKSNGRNLHPEPAEEHGD